MAEVSPEGVRLVPTSAVTPNKRQPRTVFEEGPLDELAASIREVGVLQPLVVRAIQGGKYELIAGERRLRASKLAGLEVVPVILRTASDRESLELAIVENVQREDISPIESARAYRKLMDEFDLTQEEVAKKVGKSRVAVANTVRLLRLPQRIQLGLEEGKLTEGHARALLQFPTPEAQLAVYDEILAKGLSVKQVELMAQRSASVRQKAPKAGTLDPHLPLLEEGMSTLFGTPVKIDHTSGSGRIVIQFYSEDDLIRITDTLGIQI